MKFWKILSGLIEQALPDWRDKFLSYKDLKKQLRMIYPKEEDFSIEVDAGRPSKRLRVADDEMGQRESDSGVVDGEVVTKEVKDFVVTKEVKDFVVTKEVKDFVKLLEKEIRKFNAFFIDKEEEYVIRLKVLQERVEEARSLNVDLLGVGRQIVDFHGEVVLLENYSALNYIGLVKILKKHDKRSGAITRSPFIQKVLQEPFVRTDVLNKLVKECEIMLDHLFSLNELSIQTEATEANEGSDTSAASGSNESTLKVPEDLAEIEHMENMYLKLTTSAYQVLKEIRCGSSTVSMFSLPPMQSNELEEVWRKFPFFEQAAK